MTESIAPSLTLATIQRPRIGHELVRRLQLPEQLHPPHNPAEIAARWLRAGAWCAAQ